MSTRETTHLQPAFLLEAPKRIPDLRLFRRNVLAVRIENRGMRAGIKGQADLYGFWKGGRPIELELKAAHRHQRPEQKVWAEWCHAWGVPYLLLKARPEETLEETVSRWCSEVEALRPAQ
jgi:hypothetical protein